MTAIATTAAPQQPPESAAPRRPDLRPQFFLGLEDSSLVATDTLLQIKDTVVDTVESRAMSVVYGDAGLGKSFGTRATIQEMNPDLILPLDFACSRPGPKDLREELFHHALGSLTRCCTGVGGSRSTRR